MPLKRSHISPLIRQKWQRQSYIRPLFRHLQAQNSPRRALHDRLLLLESLVVLHDERRLLGIKVGSFASADGCLCLGKELMIIGTETYVDRACQFDADEAAVAGWIGQDVVHIARGDE